MLVDAAREAGARVEVLPGPSACVTALVLSGIPCDQVLRGLFAAQTWRTGKASASSRVHPRRVAVLRVPHRAEASLEAIAEVFPGREVALCRELTKLHEEVLRDEAPVLLERLRERGELKGEMVIVVAPPSEEELERLGAVFRLVDEGAAVDPEELLRSDIAEGLAAGDSANALAKRLAQKYSRKKRDVYNLVLEAQQEA